MAEFSVKTNTVKEAADTQEKLLKELDDIQQSVRKISGSLALKTSAAGGIKTRLSNLAGRIEDQKTGMRGMKNALDRAAYIYEETEKNICGYTEEEIKTQKKSGIAGTHSVLGDIIKPLYTDIDAGNYVEYLTGRLESIRNFAATVYKGDPAFLSNLLMIPPFVLKDPDAFHSFIDKLKDGIQNKEDVTSFDWKGKVQGALYDKEISGKSGSLGVTASAYEAYVDAKGGLFTENEEGNRVFNPNVDAKMGASYTLLTATGNFAAGDEMLGTYAAGEVTAGQVSGNAEIKASLRDKDGNINPHAQMSARMEAVAVKAEAQAGVTVLGTDAKVSGSVYAGLGAHADVKIGDGKIKCDVGAALGIGVSLGFEIDYGGTVDAVKKAASSIFRKVRLW